MALGIRAHPMKLRQLLFESCGPKCSGLDILLIRMFSTVVGLLGVLYTFFWVRWLVVAFVPHPRAWLDTYLVVGIPMLIFAVGAFLLVRMFLLLGGAFFIFIALGLISASALTSCDTSLIQVLQIAISVGVLLLLGIRAIRVSTSG